MPSAAFSTDLELNLNTVTIPPQLNIRISAIDTAAYIKNLDQGFRSEIIYFVRTYKPEASTALFRSERTTVKIIKTAGKDFLTGRYYILENGEEKSFSDAAAFTENFFSCSAEVTDKSLTGEFEIEVKVKADLIKRPRPLALLDPFLTNEKTEIGWIRYGNRK